MLNITNDYDDFSKSTPFMDDENADIISMLIFYFYPSQAVCYYNLS